MMNVGMTSKPYGYSYQKNATIHGKQKSDQMGKTEETETAKNNGKLDSFEFSIAFKSETTDKPQVSYDINKVMEIHKKGFSQVPSKEESDYYWAARKSDPELDAALYEQDKAEALKFVGQVQNILMKAMTGQPLTPEEQEMVKNDPMLQQEIEMRKSKVDMFK